MIQINIPKKISKKKGNDYQVSGADVIVNVRDKKGKLKCNFLIDLDIWEQVKDYYWNTKPSFKGDLYVHNPTIGYLHKIIHNSPEGKEVDHINGNRMDNRLSNLRVCTHRENSRNLCLKKNNTSGYPGIVKDKRTGCWMARIKLNYKDKSLGYFKDKEEAIKCRKEAEDKYFGEFSPNRSRDGKV